MDGSVLAALLRYTVIDKALQFAASLSFVFVVAKSLSSQDYAVWSMAVGAYLSICAAFMVMPSEVLARYNGGLSGRYGCERTLLVSVVGRFALSVTIGVGAAVLVAGKMESAAKSTFGLLVLLALAIEIMGFTATFSIQKSRLPSLAIARAGALVAKIVAVAGLLYFEASPVFVAFIYFSDSLLYIAYTSWFSLRQSMAVSYTRRLVSSFRRCKIFLLHQCRSQGGMLPSVLAVILYNTALRSDRLSFVVTEQNTALVYQTITMQFIDPLVLLFTGFVGNMYYRQQQPSRALILPAYVVLSIAAAVFGTMGSQLLAFAPANLKAASHHFVLASWYIPIYCGFALVFLKQFYSGKSETSGLLEAVGFLTVVVAPALMYGDEFPANQYVQVILLWTYVGVRVMVCGKQSGGRPS